VLLMTMLGAGGGALVLQRVPDAWVNAAVVFSIALTLYFEQRSPDAAKCVATPVLALAAGASSGFSGTSGPLKGLAIRNLGLDRMHFVGACSAVSLAGDGMKVLVLSRADLLGEQSWAIIVGALPLIPLAAWCGRLVNRHCGERPFRRLFCLMMGGYAVRLLAG
jgi:uncharacterized membrane protein YfcA